MKYEAPELAALMPAINAIQGTDPTYKANGPLESFDRDVATAAYADWED